MGNLGLGLIRTRRDLEGKERQCNAQRDLAFTVGAGMCGKKTELPAGCLLAAAVPCGRTHLFGRRHFPFRFLHIIVEWLSIRYTARECFSGARDCSGCNNW